MHTDYAAARALNVTRVTCWTLQPYRYTVVFVGRACVAPHGVKAVQLDKTNAREVTAAIVAAAAPHPGVVIDLHMNAKAADVAVECLRAAAHLETGANHPRRQGGCTAERGLDVMAKLIEACHLELQLLRFAALSGVLATRDGESTQRRPDVNMTDDNWPVRPSTAHGTSTPHAELCDYTYAVTGFTNGLIRNR